MFNVTSTIFQLYRGGNMARPWVDFPEVTTNRTFFGMLEFGPHFDYNC
jgi:hypothetical protein